MENIVAFVLGILTGVILIQGLVKISGVGCWALGFVVLGVGVGKVQAFHFINPTPALVQVTAWNSMGGSTNNPSSYWFDIGIAANSTQDYGSGDTYAPFKITWAGGSVIVQSSSDTVTVGGSGAPTQFYFTKCFTNSVPGSNCEIYALYHPVSGQRTAGVLVCPGSPGCITVGPVTSKEGWIVITPITGADITWSIDDNDPGALNPGWDPGDDQWGGTIDPNDPGWDPTVPGGGTGPSGGGKLPSPSSDAIGVTEAVHQEGQRITGAVAAVGDKVTVLKDAMVSGLEGIQEGTDYLGLMAEDNWDMLSDFKDMVDDGLIGPVGQMTDYLGNISTNAYVTARELVSLNQGLFGNGSNIVGQIPYQNLMLFGNGSNKTGFISQAFTNLFGDGTGGVHGVLYDIQTNTAALALLTAGLTNRLSETSLQDGLDKLQGLASYGMNEVWGNWGTSQVGQTMIILSNGVNKAGWREAPVQQQLNDASTAGFYFSLGRGHTLKMDTLGSGGPRSMLATAAVWVHRMLEWALLFFTFWACWNELQRQVEVALTCGAQVVIPPLKWDEIAALFATGGTVGTLWIAAKKAVAGFLAMLITVIIGILPTTMTVFLLGVMGASPLGGVNPISDLAGGGMGGLSSIALGFAKQLGAMFPFTVFFTAMTNIAFFRFYSFSVLMVVMWMLRWMVQAERNSSMIGPMTAIALLAGALECNGVGVQLENFTPSVQGMTNSDGMGYSVPVGTTSLNLSEGEWLFGTNSVVIAGDEGTVQVVRLVSNYSTNGPPLLVYSSQSQSPIGAYWTGFSLGITIWGFVWAVLAVKKSVTLGWHNHV